MSTAPTTARMNVENSAIVAPQCVDEDEGAQSAQEEETDAADKHMLLDNQCWLSARVKRDTTTAKAAWRAMSSMGPPYRRLMP